jgi:hypothetical protein
MSELRGGYAFEACDRVASSKGHLKDANLATGILKSSSSTEGARVRGLKLSGIVERLPRTTSALRTTHVREPSKVAPQRRCDPTNAAGRCKGRADPFRADASACQVGQAYAIARLHPRLDFSARPALV